MLSGWEWKLSFQGTWEVSGRCRVWRQVLQLRGDSVLWP